MRSILTLSLMLGTGASLAQNATPFEAAPVAMVAEWATTGHRAYQVVNNGEVDGRIEVFSEFVDGDYVIHDHSMSRGLGVDEDLFMRLDGTSFAPQSVHVGGDFSGTHVMASFQFDDGKAIGDLHLHRPADGRHQHRPAEVPVPEGFFLRGSALYLVNAMKDIQPGGEVRLNWFNSLNGQLSEITLTVEGTETVEVPAGRFDCLVVRQTGGQPGNLIYISTEDRRIVRFDVVGQPMTLELLPDASGP